MTKRNHKNMSDLQIMGLIEETLPMASDVPQAFTLPRHKTHEIHEALNARSTIALTEEVDAATAEAKAEKTDAGFTRIFDSLKPKQVIWMSWTAVMGTQAKGYKKYTVGRKSVSKKYGVTSITILRDGETKARALTKLTLMKRSNGGVSLAVGDMATNLHGIYVPGKNESTETDAPALHEMLTGIRQGLYEKNSFSDDEMFEAVMATEPLSRRITETRGVLGAGGLSQPKGTQVHLQPNTAYYMGASSSPSMIIIKSVSDDIISYIGQPFNKGSQVRKIQTWVGRDLIQKGTSQWLKMYAKYQPQLAKELKSLLYGKPVKPNGDRFMSVKVIVQATKEGDMWRDAEQYGNVGGFSDDPSKYEIVTNKGALEKLKKDKNFKVLSTVFEGVETE